MPSALALGDDALALLSAAQGGAFSPLAALGLIEAGRAELLIGQAENSWLECKGQPYPNTEVGRLELAKDVSAFANSAVGGLICVGLRTNSVHGQDIVSAVRPVPHDDRLPVQYRRWIDQRVFPRLDGLNVRSHPVDEGHSIVTILVPPQPPALRPFLVKGTLKDPKIVGTHMAIFTRRDDATLPIGIEELHSLLVSGRAALGYDRSD